MFWSFIEELKLYIVSQCYHEDYKNYKDYKTIKNLSEDNDPIYKL